MVITSEHFLEIGLDIIRKTLKVVVLGIDDL